MGFPSFTRVNTFPFCVILYTLLGNIISKGTTDLTSEKLRPNCKSNYSAEPDDRLDESIII